MQYYYHHNGQQYGPFTIEELRAKSIHTDTLIWRNGMEQWSTAGQLDELSSLFPPIVNVTPPVPPNYIPYHAPATPKGDRSWVGIVAAVGLVVVFVVFLVWRQTNKSSAPVMGSSGLITLNQDSLRELENQVLREQLEKKEADAKAKEMQHWRELVKSEILGANALGSFGGFKDVTFQVTNNLSHEIKWMVVELEYTLQNGRLYATREVEVMNIEPSKSVSIIGPGMNRGYKVDSKVKYINVPDLGLDFGSEAYRTKREIGKLFE